MIGKDVIWGDAMIKTKIATVTINLIVAAAIVLLNLIINSFRKMNTSLL